MNAILILGNIFIYAFMIFRIGQEYGEWKTKKHHTCKKCGQYYNHSDWRYVDGESAQVMARNGYCNDCASAIAGQA